MLPFTIDNILKPKTSQLTLRNREESEENLEYVSHKKLEKLKTSYQNSLEKSKVSGPKSVSQHAEEKSVNSYKSKSTKKRCVFRGPGSSNDKLSSEIYNAQLNPFKTTYDDDYVIGNPNRKSLSLKAKIQQKLQNSNEILQKKLSFVNIKKSLPHVNVSNFIEYKNKTVEKETKKLVPTTEREIVQTQNADDFYKGTDENYVTQVEENSVSPQADCFMPDWSSISENHWQDLLNSDIFKNFNINPITLIENNPEYFSHLLGLCACMRCKCGLCKCKYAESKNATLRLIPNISQTVYQREYFDKMSDVKLNPGLTSSLMYPFVGDGAKPLALAYTTTHQAEYRPYAVTPHQRKFRHYSDNKYPFLSLSTYNSNFVDWRNYNQMKVRMPQQITTIKERPFFDRTTYKDNFMSLKFDPSNTEFVKNIQQNRTKVGIFNQIPFLSETQHTMNFKPYKIGKPLDGAKTSCYKTPSNLEILNERPQEGHYMSMTAHDFKGTQDFICPAKQKIDLDSLKSQIYNKLDNINSVHKKTKSDERRTQIITKRGKS